MRTAGEVVRADVLTGHYGRSKGCGIVEYATVEEAAGAVASARLLLERLDRRAARATDAEGSTPADLAAAAGHKELAAELAAAAAAAGAPDETIAEEAAGGVCDRAGELEGEQREFAEATERSAQSLLMLINDLLDFSKIEAGQLTLEEVPMDLRTVMDDVGELGSMFVFVCHATE